LHDTRADDDDPLDVRVLTDEPLFTGCFVDSALVGVVKPKHKDRNQFKRNNRLIAIHK
jgi:inorganic pyrophosphatase